MASSGLHITHYLRLAGDPLLLKSCMDVTVTLQGNQDLPHPYHLGLSREFVCVVSLSILLFMNVERSR